MQYKFHDLNSNGREIMQDNLVNGPYPEDDKPAKFTSVSMLILKQLRVATMESGTQYPVTATIQPVMIIQ